MKRLSQFLAACQSKAGRRMAGWGAVPGACSGPAHLTHLRCSGSEDSAVNTKEDKPCPPRLTVQWKENDVSTGLPHGLSTQHWLPLLRSRRARGPPRSPRPFDNQGQKRTQVSVFCLPRRAPTGQCSNELGNLPRFPLNTPVLMGLQSSAGEAGAAAPL